MSRDVSLTPILLATDLALTQGVFRAPLANGRAGATLSYEPDEKWRDAYGVEKDLRPRRHLRKEEKETGERGKKHNLPSEAPPTHQP